MKPRHVIAKEEMSLARIGLNQLMTQCTMELLRKKKIVRQPCAHCGASKAQAHHANYHDPFTLLWVCRLCHIKEHRRMRAAGESAYPDIPLDDYLAACWRLEVMEDREIETMMGIKWNRKDIDMKKLRAHLCDDLLVIPFFMLQRPVRKIIAHMINHGLTSHG